MRPRCGREAWRAAGREPSAAGLKQTSAAEAGWFGGKLWHAEARLRQAGHALTES